MPESGTVSTNVVEPEPSVAPVEPHPVSGSARSRTLPAALAPVFAAGVALLVHHALPGGRELPMSWLDKLPAWQHPYPLLLDALLAASLSWLMAQAAWRPLRPWVRHYGPLMGGAIMWLAVWELATVKLAWFSQQF